MSGIKKDTSDLLFNGITMKVAIDAGYRLDDLSLVVQLHHKLIRKYNSLNKNERAGLRAQAQAYIDSRLANIEKKQEEQRNAKDNESPSNEPTTDSGSSEAADAATTDSTEVSNP